MKPILYISLLFFITSCIQCPEYPVKQTVYDTVTVYDTLQVKDSIIYTYIVDTQLYCIDTKLSEDILRKWESELLEDHYKNEREKDSLKKEKQKLEKAINKHVDYVDSINRYAKTLNEFKDFTNWWVQQQADSLYLVYYKKDSLLLAGFKRKNALIYDMLSDTLIKLGGMYKNESKNIVMAPIWRNDSLKTF